MVLRRIPIATALLAIAISAAPASAQRYAFGAIPSNPHDHYVSNSVYVPIRSDGVAYRFTQRITARQIDQLVRWGAVGRCVATREHDASLSYVAARRGSGDALAAEKRLDPSFAACFVDAGVKGQGNKAYRRAAIADALGVRLPEHS